MEDKTTLYARWLNGELSKTELEDLRSDGTVEELERIIQTTDELQLPAYDLDEAYNRFKTKATRKEAKIRRLQPVWLIGIAASFLLLIGLFFWVYQPNQQLMAANGATAIENFEDGTQITLNDGSAILYNKGKWETKREVELKGEAYFEVSTTNRPFLVTTTQGLVEVLGTKFNVRTWADKLYVACYEGSVKVSHLTSAVPVTLVQGKTVVFRSDGTRQEGSTDNAIPSWMNGASSFINASILEVFNELERQYNVTVIADIKDQPFSGTFQHDNLQSTLEDICDPLNLKFSLESPKEILILEK